ncbi:MAG: peptidylprolyl isomerase [Rhodospirillaceae bacterium]|jgi:peptidylprolyl isomerase|nr:peptidylprolyl isomerase [Rhodospirillaceae bacterium]MBT4218924.1 peptidylprolyl isomerase [Rhodospirillaceae bacterium]MBT4464730.1 peptidylprolyl isomerase [Rhodospirillaceae bacterium]MBT5013526.1 peptidylprolyl isomerase [Rhodospirillaceae bacterium]MBT7356614.1 peptidylprolyl isomerase [Rhodospirillaceae bacterium]
MFRIPLIAVSLLIALIMTSIPEDVDAAEIKDPENALYLELKDGRVVIELRPDLAPNHVARIKELVRKKFYDGIVFHRVIGGFMAQTGDPTGTGMGGSGKNLDAEFSDEPHVRGTLSMARSANPNSADSQFFIVFAKTAHLDGQYTVWGKVISGMAAVGKIKRGEQSSNGAVDDPDKIISMRVVADFKE